MNQRIPNEPAAYGSDVVAETLRDLDLRYIALNPGASYRGLHDSLVNFTRGNPEVLLCIHEEAAVAIAHGWARVTGRPMAVALHSNVGLMHASMGIFNAFCDRLPMVIVAYDPATKTVGGVTAVIDPKTGKPVALGAGAPALTGQKTKVPDAVWPELKAFKPTSYFAVSI